MYFLFRQRTMSGVCLGREAFLSHHCTCELIQGHCRLTDSLPQDPSKPPLLQGPQGPSVHIIFLPFNHPTDQLTKA